jgi:hypothetical protein
MEYMNTCKIELQKYTKTIRPRRSLFDFQLKSVWEYRDFKYLIFFEARILIYAALIICLNNSITSGYGHFVTANPFFGVVELFSWSMFINSFTFMTFLISSGILIFNNVEHCRMDTV